MKKRFTFLAIAVSLTVLYRCTDSLEYSPNQIFDNNSPRDLNKTNIRRLQKQEVDDTITIAFVGDSQRFYDEVEDFVDAVNRIPDVDFSILAGDISDFGLLNEFEWIAEAMKHLSAPYVAVIGNHDIVANGEAVYEKMFGPLNFSFVYDSVKFVFHNTNSREYIKGNVPDLPWLEQELSVEDPSIKNYIAVSHVPPYDNDFNRSLEEPYARLFSNRSGFLVSLHGHIHQHRDGYPYQDGVRYMTSFPFADRNFILLKIYQGQVDKKIIHF